jgi:hypothetical protein
MVKIFVCFIYKTKNTKRVNLNVIGKFGATKVVASFRTDDQDANRSSASNLHQFYITTKVGPVNGSDY